MNYKKLIFTLLITFISAINCGPKKNMSTIQYSALRERMLNNPALKNDPTFQKEYKRAKKERLEKEQAKKERLEKEEALRIAKQSRPVIRNFPLHPDEIHPDEKTKHHNLVKARKPLSVQEYLFLQAMLEYVE